MRREALASGVGLKRSRPEPLTKSTLLAPKRPAVTARPAQPLAPVAKSVKSPPPVRGPPTAPYGPTVNEFVGRRVQLYWPEEGGWFDAVVTDYNPATDEHCVTYHMNAANESFEWSNLKKLGRDEFRWVPGPALSVHEMFPAGVLPGGGRAGAAQRAGGGARPPALAGTPKSAAVAEIDKKLKSAKDLAATNAVRSQIEIDEARVRAELQALDDSDEDDGLPPPGGGSGGGPGGGEGGIIPQAAGGALEGAAVGEDNAVNGDQANATDGDSD